MYVAFLRNFLVRGFCNGTRFEGPKQGYEHTLAGVVPTLSVAV